jgi:hypothetical protein
MTCRIRKVTAAQFALAGQVGLLMAILDMITGKMLIPLLVLLVPLRNPHIQASQAYRDILEIREIILCRRVLPRATQSMAPAIGTTRKCHLPMSMPWPRPHTWPPHLTVSVHGRIIQDKHRRWDQDSQHRSWVQLQPPYMLKPHLPITACWPQIQEWVHSTNPSSANAQRLLTIITLTIGIFPAIWSTAATSFTSTSQRWLNCV